MLKAGASFILWIAGCNAGRFFCWQGLHRLWEKLLAPNNKLLRCFSSIIGQILYLKQPIRIQGIGLDPTYYGCKGTHWKKVIAPVSFPQQLPVKVISGAGTPSWAKCHGGAAVRGRNCAELSPTSARKRRRSCPFSLSHCSLPVWICWGSQRTAWWKGKAGISVSIGNSQPTTIHQNPSEYRWGIEWLNASQSKKIR